MKNVFTFKVFFLISLILLPYQVSAVIHETKTMDEVCAFFRDSNPEDFAIFDIDYALTQPSDPYLQSATFTEHKTIVKSVVNSLSPDQVDAFYSLVIASSPGELIDKKSLNLLENLKSKKVKTIAFTGLVTGQLDNTPSLEMWRIQDLKNLGISFTTLFQDNREIVFDEIPTYRNNHPVFKEGVLFSNGVYRASKGEVLLAFLKRVELNPKRIFFMDDSLDNLESAEKALKKQYPEIGFVGLHYMGAKDVRTPAIEASKFEKKYQLFADRIKQLP